ncbi:hypothetical protein [Niabella hirudinis]|uniref:hypothetical protein n=1 Tax=Niabella hirudinis TaxID=1285929 RepID=UPI003EBE0D94
MKLQTQYNIGAHRQLIIPREALCRTYGTIITYDENLKIHYEMDIARLGEFEQEGYLYFVNRKQVYINNSAPRLLADQLADAMGRTLYPVLLMVNHEGGFGKIINHPDILERWRASKPAILQYFKGAAAEQAMQEMEIRLHDIDRVEAALKEDWFFTVFFAAIYGERAFSYKLELDLPLPMIAYGPGVKYRFTGSLEQQDTAKKTFTIHYKGNINEERSLKDILEKRPLPMEKAMDYPAAEASGSATLNYQVYRKDYSIRSAWGTMVLQGNPDRKVKFETYHQDTSDRQLDAAIRFEEMVKKKFWAG